MTVNFTELSNHFY